MAQQILFVAQVIIHRVKSPQLIIKIGQIPFAALDHLTPRVDDAELEDNPRWIKLVGYTHLIGLRPAPRLEIAGEINVGDSNDPDSSPAAASPRPFLA